VSNIIDIQIDELKKHFKNHTLKQCADKFGCSKVTIKRKLKAAGADTSIHNHSQLALEAHRNTLKDTSQLTKEFLCQEYIVQNKDTKTIAEETGFHFNTIRNRVRKFGFKKDPKNVSISMSLRYMKKTGYAHPGHNPINIAKINKRRSRFEYQPIKSEKVVLFRSLHELCHALLLDNDPDVESWDYELIKIPYMDVVKKRMRMYYVDFSIQAKSGDRWVEVKPANKMIPHMKRLYASYAAKKAGIKFRGLTDDERKLAYELFLSGYGHDRIGFRNVKSLKLGSCYTLWFKDIKELRGIEHDHYEYTDRPGPYCRCKFKAKAKNKLITSN
jgi:hypothetical protein